LINRSVRTFWDGLSLGGEPQDVGNEASAFALKISLLRAQRSQIASGFAWLTISMHAVLTALSVFIYSVFVSFSALVQELMPKEGLSGELAPGLPQFGLFSQNSTHLGLLYFMVMTIVVVLTLANAFAIYAVSGGTAKKLLFYLALTGGISGGVLIVVPSVAKVLFSAM
jgi:archaellum biogenesis protein FlaJ (TadC family)